jgi:hypothetical protein
MIDFRNYINPQPRGKFTAAWQLAFLPDGENYLEDKGGKVIDTLTRSVRTGTIVRVRRLFCLGPWNGTPRKRREIVAKRVDAIKARGGIVLEAETQRRSDVRGNMAQMLMGAYEDIARGGRAISRNRTGRPAQEFTADQQNAMKQIWFSRRYKTRKEATAAIHSLGIKVSTALLYRIFGLPDREAANATEVINLIPDPPKGSKRKRVAYVYFIKDGDKVKIGHSVHPTVRMKNLTTHSKLELLGILAGGRKRELALHDKFDKYRIEGTREWFKLVPEIIKYIAVNKRRNGI